MYFNTDIDEVMIRLEELLKAVELLFDNVKDNGDKSNPTEMIVNTDDMVRLNESFYELISLIEE